MTTSPDTNTITSTPPTNNWMTWFNSRESSEFVNKHAQEELFKAFNVTIDTKDCTKKLIDHQEVFFLFKETFGDWLNVFHR